MKSMIFYDSVIRTRAEWENSLGIFKESSRVVELNNQLIDSSYYGALQSWYFAILHNNPKEIRSKIRMQVKRKLGMESIAEEAILDSGKNCEVYRITSAEEIEIYRKGILDRQNSWKEMEGLHSKGPRAIRNLIEKLESGEFS